MATDKNSSSAGGSLQQPINKCPQNYKPWIWTLVVMAAITTAWAVYEGFQKDGYFTNAFNRGQNKAPEWGSKKFALQSAGVAPEQVKGLQTSYHSIIDSVRPAVITIDAVGNTQVAGTLPPEIEPEIPVAAFARVGSGVIIEPRGYVLSSYHVIAGSESLKATVYGPGGALQYPIKLVKADIRSDLALLRIQGPGPFP
ncbi:MAG TPA: hypothetical protein HPP76_08835, partial [Desulfuromonadales bacterium]|nr:hypothetical protein [Desulfuromonadales bacterium]